MNIQKYKASPAFDQIKNLVLKAEAMRRDERSPIDVSLMDLAEQELQIAPADFFDTLGVDLGIDTIQNLLTTPDLDVRWLVPEIYREALRLGVRQNPIWPNIIAAEEQMTGLSQIMPHINMSASKPMRVGEGETIPLGMVSYGSKQFRISKFGRGIGLTDEVVRYVNLNVVSLFLQDFGAKMGMGIDSLAIYCLINGEQADNSEAAPVVGVATPKTLVFRDILKIWLRMSKIGRFPTTIVGNEDMALETWDLDEFKLRQSSGPTQYTLNIKTPLPQSANYWIHAGVPEDQQIILDPKSALIKFNAIPMLIESERIVSNQTSNFYASFVTGFAKMFTDAAVIQDMSLDFATDHFPEEMDVYAETLVDMTNKSKEYDTEARS